MSEGVAQPAPQKWLGELAMVVSTVIYAAQALVAKIVEEEITALELVTYRSVVAGCITLFVLARGEGERFDERLFGSRSMRRLVVLRGALGATAFAVLMWSLHLVGVGEYTALLFTNPVWISLGAWPTLGEKPSLIVIFSIVCGVLGTLCVTEPRWLFPRSAEEGSERRNLGIAVLLFGSLLMSATMLVIRAIGRRVKSLQLALSFHLFSSTFGANGLALGLQAPKLPPSPKMFVLVLAVSTSSFVGQPLLSYSYQTLPAAKAASLSYLQLLWAFVLGAAFRHERPSIWPQLAGASLIALGGLCVALCSPAKKTTTTPTLKCPPSSASGSSLVAKGGTADTVALIEEDGF